MADTSAKDRAPETAGKTQTIIPAVNFTGFPFGGRGMLFKAGVESIPIPADYAQLMRDKGLVADK